MGNSLCSSKCISEGSSLDTAVGKCQNNPCKCALSCFNSVKEEIQIADKIKELIDAAVERQLKGLEKPDNDIKPDLSNDLP